MTVFGVAVRAALYHWRTHVPALAFVGLATAIVTGSLEVQTSIQSYLRGQLVAPVARIVRVDSSSGTFRTALANPGQVPALVLNTTASGEDGRASSPATVWGLGPDSSKLWDGLMPVAAGQAEITRSLAQALGLSVGSRVFLRLPLVNEAPLSSVFGRRLAKDSSIEVSAEVVGILRGPFTRVSLVPKLGEKSLVLLNRDWLSHALKIPGRVNLILTPRSSDRTPTSLRLELSDHGLSVTGADSGVTVRSDHVMLTSGQVAACQSAAKAIGCWAVPSLVALADSVQDGDRQISYAMVASGATAPGAFDLNEWASADLHAKKGDRIGVSLLIPKSDGSYSRREVEGVVGRILPMSNVDASVTPSLRGMTDSKSISDWNTPFPIDLSRITTRDEAYWKQYRASPRIFADISTVRMAWASRDAVTAVSVHGAHIGRFSKALLEALKPEDSGISTAYLRENAVRAAAGSSDLAGLILGLSSFLIVASFGLSVSLLRLNFQSRSKQFALMSFLGLPSKRVFRLLFVEALLVSAVGALSGTCLGPLLAGASLGMFSRWMPSSAGLGRVEVAIRGGDLLVGLGVGVLSGLVASLLCTVPLMRPSRSRRTRLRSVVEGRLQSGLGLLWKSFNYRPMRVISVALIVAAGTFVLSVAAGSYGSGSNGSGTGGIALQVESSTPIAIDWTSPEGRRRLRFDPADEPVLKGVTAYALLQSPGVDASCLNPAKPVVPRLAAVDSSFVQDRPFAAEGPGGWDALNLPTEPDVASIADGDTLDWILDSGVGKRFRLLLPDGRVANLKFVGATHGTFLAGELLVSQAGFHRLYPEIDSPSLFLVKVPRGRESLVKGALTRNLADYGVTVQETSAILSSLRGVYNAYISIFLVFGSLGLLLGVCGAALAAARNALERRAEFGLMLAVGLPRSLVGYWIVAETHVGVLAGGMVGLLLGAVVAVTERTSVSWGALLVGVGAIAITSTLACVCVSAAFLRRGVIQALRSE